MHRRTLFAAALLPIPALAQEAYPSRPIRVMVPFAVGGITDVVARVMAEPMSISLGRPLVIDNQGGAGSTIGAAVVGRAAPDGYTLMVGSVGHTVMDVLYPNFPFKPAQDFVPVALLGRQPFVVAVHPSVPATNIAEFLAWLRTKGAEANFGTAGIGSTSHLSAELLKSLAGVDFTVVPYRGTPQAVTDLTAGRVDFMVDSQTLLAPLIADGRVRGLAVTTPVRSRLLPALPTLAEAGVTGYDASAWQAIYVPAGTPAPIRQALEATALRALADPAIQRRMGDIGVDPFADGSAAAAQAYLEAEVVKWAALVRAAGIRGG
ncbi:Bug family tripartite tricarboxylate transporter substrate binding protein [Humitalea sp. 24SJ18S-53]|uniref:Bug family tripartite tricarboxylate transporter substrate binding protein n=1 Tax=Humitalea sp. 24SJ18S-53 TaxID=3422307 RepID=UPI003D6749CD